VASASKPGAAIARFAEIEGLKLPPPGLRRVPVKAPFGKLV
jgi:hypothetical protein